MTGPEISVRNVQRKIWVDVAKRDHFDFMQKMRDRGVEVVEMRNLLTETVAIPEAKAWILDNKECLVQGRGSEAATEDLALIAAEQPKRQSCSTS